MLLENRTIVITGAGGGLGRGIAEVCHREGANVVIADVRAEAARSAAAALGERALAVSCDVRRDEDLASLLDQALERFGVIDGLVNNAGVNFVKPFLDTTAEDWDGVMSVDLRAVFLLMRLVSRQMLSQAPAGGSIVNISSVHSFASVPGAAPYDAAKCGVVGLTKSFAVEFARQGIRANVISPGLLDTQIWQDVLNAAPDQAACRGYWHANIPMGRILGVREIGELAAFLLSDRASSITGANIMADAGMTSQLVSRQPYGSGPFEAN